MVQVIDPKVLTRSIRSIPKITKPAQASTMGNASTMFFANIAQTADEFEPFWGNLKKRDQQLREFWVEEPILSSAIYSIVSSRVAFGWKLDGPPRTVNRVQQMLHASNLGKGWQSLMSMIAVDLLTQDNGAFLEVIRAKNNPSSPVINLAWLDSSKCQRTGDPRNPVVYTNKGKAHLLKWYQVCTFEDMPYPADGLGGRQVSLLTRVLRAAQIVRDIGIYKREKVSGRFNRTLHLVGGAKRSEIEDAKHAAGERADNMGLSRYMEPIIMASLDPTASVSHVQIDLASLPDGFDEDSTFKWYIIQIAMGAGADFQDFAPLMSGSLGSSQQSEILHKKARAKGHTLWQKMWEHKLTFYKILPPSVQFKFEQIDTGEEIDIAKLKKLRAETRKIMIDSQEITAMIARQIAADDGDLKEEYLAIMGDEDLTPEIWLPDDERISIVDIPIAPTEANPLGKLPILDVTQANKDISPLQKEFIEDQADSLAAWWRGVIDISPAQLSWPVMESKLNTFQYELARFIRENHITLINTNNLLDANPLAISGVKGGISPREMSLRLPKYRTTRITAEGIHVYRGKNLIQTLDVDKSCTTRKEVRTSTLPFILHTPGLAEAEICMECGKVLKSPRVYYRPLSGFRIICNHHHKALGLSGRISSYQPNPKELQQLYLGQLSSILAESSEIDIQPLIASATTLAYLIGKNKIDSELMQEDIKVIQESLKRQTDIAVLIAQDLSRNLSINHWMDIVRLEWNTLTFS